MHEFITWKTVTAFIGGVGTVCLTIWRIFSTDFSKKDDKSTDKRIAKLSEENAIQTIQIADLEKRVDRLQASHDKLSDLILKLLTEK